MDEPLWSRSATWLAGAIAAGDVSSLEAVDACLARIEDVNPRINAVVRLADDARRQGPIRRRRAGRGRRRGPLHGVPFTIKDSLDTAGVVTTAGTVGLARPRPGSDATVVARLRGRRRRSCSARPTRPEFTWANETDNDVYGRTSNPYDLDRTPGGSSGGSAAIVAAGGAPFDIGSDSGNSIRQPAHLCGVAGIKPTSGRVPRTGHSPGVRGPVPVVHPAGPDRPPGRGPGARSCRSSPVRTARIRTSCRRPSAIPRRRRLAAAGRLVRRQRRPDADARDDRRRPGRGRRDRGDRGDDRGRGAAGPPDARPAWEAVIRADGFAWLWRLIEQAGTPGTARTTGSAWVSARPGEPYPGDEVSAAVERADAVRSRLLRWMRPST